MVDDWTNRLSDYIDGEMSDSDTKSIEAHLSTCKACSDTVEQLRAVVSRAGHLQDLGERVGELGTVAAELAWIHGLPRGDPVERLFGQRDQPFVAWIGCRHGAFRSGWRRARACAA